MDGSRRVLRPLTEHFAAPLAFASARPQFAGPAARPAPRARQAPARASGGWLSKLHAIAVHPLSSGALVFGVLGGAFAYSAVKGGVYDQFIHDVGTPGDLAARAIGFGIDTVTISGISELKEREVLAYAGVKARNSLPYLDAVAMRQRLMMAPLVKDAEVRKLYPGRLSITIVERQPYALWQRDGQIAIVSSDGMPIDTMHDDKYAGLPLIVGAGANLRIGEYMRIVAAAGDVGSRIKAGTLVSQRRWSIYTTDGVEIRLPEHDPEAAIALLSRLQREQRILGKDIVAIDMRFPGRVVVRLSDEAASARLDALTHKAKGKV
ncbi:MAG: cell division protein FtsQ/DivIB [Hyphomicrobiales bacterium]|nr:cell division protein FtsQ/DivIB [Hyphomicrobiales bacterium]